MVYTLTMHDKFIYYRNKDIIGGMRNGIPPEMDDEADLRCK